MMPLARSLIQGSVLLACYSAIGSVRPREHRNSITRFRWTFEPFARLVSPAVPAVSAERVVSSDVLVPKTLEAEMCPQTTTKLELQHKYNQIQFGHGEPPWP